MRYTKSYRFFDTEAEAKAFCDNYNSHATRYIKTHHPAEYTPWSSADSKEHKFVAWYVY